MKLNISVMMLGVASFANIQIQSSSIVLAFVQKSTLPSFCKLLSSSSSLLRMASAESNEEFQAPKTSRLGGNSRRE